MNLFATRKYSIYKQYAICISTVIFLCLLSYFTIPSSGYRVVALVLLLLISVLSILFDVFPVLISAALSALIWNYFFIPPTFNFHIGSSEDGLLFLMYFVIASINAVLTYKIKENEKVNQQQIEKEETIKLYNTLLNSLSHELRTPISVIIGSVDTLREQENIISEENKKTLLTEIESASLRLNRQVENLLNMSRIEAGFIKPKLEFIEVNELIYSVIGQIQKEINSHNFKVKTDENLSPLMLDRFFLEQILRNLVYNGVQNSPISSTIHIETQHEQETCKIIIYDEGTGFPFEDIEFVFNRFYRINKSKSGGTGLGLSIVKEYVEAMGGNVSLKNRADGGAYFVISFPITNEITAENYE